MRGAIAMGGYEGGRCARSLIPLPLAVRHGRGTGERLEAGDGEGRPRSGYVGCVFTMP